DYVYEQFQSMMDVPLVDRRARLKALFASADVAPRVVLSEGIECCGIGCFGEAERQGLEGVVAKRLDSRYLPGKRTEAWVKIKRQERLDCAIIGFVPEEGRTRDVGALIIAADT